jgi:small subunit ribosomal protein S11
MADNKHIFDAIHGTNRNENMNTVSGIAHIKISVNNIIVSISDINGNVIVWKTAGSLGFKGSRKSTIVAAKATGDAVAQKALSLGIQRVEVKVKCKDNDACSDAVINAIKNAGIEITSVSIARL